MRTIVLSDLHLGAVAGGDLLRRARFREIVAGEIAGAEQVVLLGDVIELRDRPVHEAIEVAAPFFSMVGESLGDGRVVLVPGNHDHHLLSTWLERRRLRGTPRSLGLEQVASGRSGPIAALARRLGNTELVMAYPGLWIRSGVYATHGHYLDCHLTVPNLERLGVALINRFVASPGEGRCTPDEYERALEPLYSFLYGLAQFGGPRARGLGTNLSYRAWRALARPQGRPDIRSRLIGSVAFPGAVLAANQLGFGPFKSDLSLEELGRAGVSAMSEVVRRLGIEAEHVIFGHTHRRGPMPGEEAWRAGRVSLHNSGSWVYAPALLTERAAESPFWPGTVVSVEDSGPPTLRHLLEERTHAELSVAP